MNGTIKRTPRDTPFVQIDKRPLEDKALSWKAKGILAYLLSKPDNWQIIINDLIARSKDGRDSTLSGIAELTTAGYIHRSLKRESGMFAGYEYEVFEVPVKDETEKTTPPETAFPETVYPETENPLPNNIYSNKNESREKAPSKIEDKLSQLSKMYKPRMSAYDMVDAKEKLELYLSEDTNLEWVRQTARTKKTPEAIRAYVLTFVQKSYTTQYIKHMQSFPELIARFSQWLSSEREEVAAKVAKNDIQDRKNDFLNHLKEKGDENWQKFEACDVKLFKEKISAIISKYPALLKMEQPDTDDWIRLAYSFDLKAATRKLLEDVIEKIANESWRQNYKKLLDSIKKTTLEYGKEK
jgi:hypothetical protein